MGLFGVSTEEGAPVLGFPYKHSRVFCVLCRTWESKLREWQRDLVFNNGHAAQADSKTGDRMENTLDFTVTALG